MKKVYLVFLRGDKETTVFKLSPTKNLDLKTLYKAFKNPKNYPNLFVGRTLSFGSKESEQFDIRVENFVSVSAKGLCKVRSEVETSQGKYQIKIEQQLNITNNDILLAEANAIVAKFATKLKQYVPTQLIEKDEVVEVTEKVEKRQLATA